jgi:hypothetical protein
MQKCKSRSASNPRRVGAFVNQPQIEGTLGCGPSRRWPWGEQFGSDRVESRCGAVAVGPTYLFPPLSSGGALMVRP